MGCIAEVIAIVLAITGLKKLDTDPTWGLIFIGASLVVAFIGWLVDRKDRQESQNDE